MALLHQYQAFSQMPFARVEIRNIAVNGNTVLTERVDHLFSVDGTRHHSAPIAGDPSRLRDRHDPALRDDFLARAQLHLLTVFLSEWQAAAIGANLAQLLALPRGQSGLVQQQLSVQ